MTRMYRWQFHFNAVHNMFPENEESRHAHSFLVILYIELEKTDIWQQNQCEKELKLFLNQFNGQYLNKMDLFADRLPTIEVICETLFPYTKEIAAKYGMKQVQIEVGDSPTALCAVGEKEGNRYKQWEDGLFFSPSL